MGCSTNKAFSDLYNNDDDNLMVIMDELENTNSAGTIQGCFYYNIINIM